MRRAFLGLMAALMLTLAVPGAASAQEEGTETTTFEAVDPAQSRHRENLSGLPFMVGSYMIIWGGLFLYLVVLQKRQGRVQRELAELRRAIEAHDAGKGRP